MSNESGQKKDRAYDYQEIARERLLWVIKPIFLVCTILWWLHPGTVHRLAVEQNTLLGFLLGALLGLLINREVLIHFLITRRQETRERKNRMPDEYYFGKVKEILQAAK